MQKDEQIIQTIDTWLQQVVIGLNLCPFAKHPYQQQQIHFAVSQASQEEALLNDLHHEAKTLLDMPPTQRETTLIILKNSLQNFDDYNQFLDLSDQLLNTMNWENQLQIASFHPDYQFAGTQPQDAQNLTNRSPYPILHLIRQTSIEHALSHYPNPPETIFENNIQTVEGLNAQQKATLFPFLTRQCD